MASFTVSGAGYRGGPPTSPVCVLNDYERSRSVCYGSPGHGVEDLGAQFGFPRFSFCGGGCWGHGPPSPPGCGTDGGYGVMAPFVGSNYLHVNYLGLNYGYYLVERAAVWDSGRSLW